MKLRPESPYAGWDNWAWEKWSIGFYDGSEFPIHAGSVYKSEYDTPYWQGVSAGIDWAMS